MDITFFVGFSAPNSNCSNGSEGLNSENADDDEQEAKERRLNCLLSNFEENNEIDDDVIVPLRSKGMQRRNAITGTSSLELMLQKVFDDPIFERHRKTSHTSNKIVPMINDSDCCDDTTEMADTSFNGVISQNRPSNRAMTMSNSIENMDNNINDQHATKDSGRRDKILSTAFTASSTKSSNNISFENEVVSSDDFLVLSDTSLLVSDTRPVVASLRWSSFFYDACKGILSRQSSDRKHIVIERDK